MKLRLFRTSRHLSTAGLAVLLGACNADPTTLSVTGSNPPAGATGVARTIAPSVTYNMAINAATVNATSVQLLGPAGLVIPGTPGVSGANVFFNSTAGAIPGGTTYTYRIQGSVTSQSGFILNTVYNVSFTTAAETWQSPLVAGSASSGTVLNPVLAADSAGNITACWIQSTSSGTSLYVNRYSASTNSWGTPTPLESSSASQPSAGPALAVDSSGNVTAAWVRNDSTATTLDSFVYTNSSSSWSSSAAPITPSVATTGAIQSPVLVVDSTGVVTAVWTQSTGGHPVLNASRRSSGTWSPVSEIDVSTVASGAVTSPVITVDPSNNVTVVWVQNNNVSRNVLMANVNSGGNWGTPVEVDSSAGATVSGPTLSVDSAGDVVAAWLQDNGTGTHNILNNSRYSAGAWSAPAEVDLATAAGSAIAPSISEDSLGNVTLVWTQSNGTVNAINYAHYDKASSTWTTPTIISTGSADAENPVIMTDIAGNTTAVWYQGAAMNSSTYNLASATWSTPTAIGAADSNDVPVPALAVDAAGNVTATWLNSTDTQIAAGRMQ